LEGGDAGVGLGPSAQVTLEPGHDRVERVDDGQAVVDDRACDRGQGEAGEPGPAGDRPQPLLDPDAAVGEHGVDAVAQRRGDLDERDPVAQQGALVAHGVGGDPGLGQQVGAQQVRQGSGVDLVVLEPGRGDRFAAARVHQVGLQAEFLQQVGQPAPAIGGLEGDRCARRQPAKQRSQLGGVVGQVAVGELRATLVDERDLGALAVHVYADVDAHQGLLPCAG
jgi:hypothetical protein